MSPTPTADVSPFAWLDGIAVAATVSDRAGICLYLNEQAAQAFAATLPHFVRDR